MSSLWGIVFLVLPFLAQASFVERLRRDYSTSMGEKVFDFELTSSYFQSQSRFDLNSNESAFSENESFSAVNTEAVFSYAPKDLLSFSLGVNFRSNSFVDSESLEHTNSGVTEGIARIIYFLPKKSKFTFSLLTEYRHKFFSSESFSASETPTVIPLGDDPNELLGLIRVGYQLNKNWSADLHLGGRYFVKDQSSELPYLFQLNWLLGKVLLQGNVSGVYSLHDDTFSEAPTDKPQIGIPGSTQLYNSINRQFLKSGGAISFALSETIGVSLFGSQTLMARSYDTGTEVGIVLKFTSKDHTKEQKEKDAFREYALEGEVIQVSPKERFVKINLGAEDNLTEEMRVDIYKTDYFGGNVLVASGVIQELGSSWAVVKLLKKYQSIPVVEGFAARAN